MPLPGSGNLHERHSRADLLNERHSRTDLLSERHSRADLLSERHSRADLLNERHRTALSCRPTEREHRSFDRGGRAAEDRQLLQVEQGWRRAEQCTGPGPRGVGSVTESVTRYGILRA
ncbi:hypothetical protein GCM10023215_64580 [Pseudonocardia yuanmonensis]|uniref:Uncharacterized protein n=1 Tax=Pseudonocardia yuanmonensis TaxID=1095914 RepID=A0ABP8XS95_9PSEU